MCKTYFEDIRHHFDVFPEIVWEMITITTKYDYPKLTKNLMHYFSIYFRHKTLSGLDSNHMDLLINKLVLPNLNISSKDIENFEDNPDDFLKNELEEYDMHSSKKMKIIL